jgi:hypothetical protein
MAVADIDDKTIDLPQANVNSLVKSFVNDGKPRP